MKILYHFVMRFVFPLVQQAVFWCGLYLCLKAAVPPVCRMMTAILK